MNVKQSLIRIRLPSHHPAVQGLKRGGMVKLHAVREDTDEDVHAMDANKGSGPRPMPLERGFHVMKIEPANVGREPSEDQKDAVKYLKGRQSVKGGGRAVS